MRVVVCFFSVPVLVEFFITDRFSGSLGLPLPYSSPPDITAHVSRIIVKVQSEGGIPCGYV